MKSKLNFDKLLVVCDCSAIRVVRRNVFSENVTKKVLHYRDPECRLDIIVDFGHDYFTLEFTSSILRESMKELINTETIRRCFENINKLNVVALEIDYILEHAVVCKADVTMDKLAGDQFVKRGVPSDHGLRGPASLRKGTCCRCASCRTSWGCRSCRSPRGGRCRR